ncbi:MAG: methylenetetrahydrofolate reductase [NAD(P)H] [Nitrospirae bacterium]|nr:methylenetetrahydrofolate reductase [NAD(P)H] [Nitrospirota bacterium]
MKISNLLQSKSPVFSLEFFPPKNPDGERKLYDTIRNLRHLNPAFVSVTYGAGGSTREKTVDLVIRIKHELGIEPMAHLTCVNSSETEINTILTRLQERGIDNILALRGDIPGQEGHDIRNEAFHHANELIGHIRKNYDFCLGAAAFPEGHKESMTLQEDTSCMKMKAEAGADFFITQLFFDNQYYFKLIERTQQAGLNLPIIPGIMPITSIDQIERFTSLCGATIPDDLITQLESVKENPAAVMDIGVRHAADQCRDLLKNGVPGIHFYTLNRSPATIAILKELQG